MKNFEEYHNLYLETDIFLLVNIFMNYTIICLNNDGLDSSHYVFVSECLYKSSRAELKLMTNMNEYLIVKKGIREDMIMASYYYAKANNPKCSDYNLSKSTS
ncbi:3936_t:CDS:1 [Funneliformis mosseae]|uniref:3936_t:CDS:1 n=1 Tax=Funneliformis mosseae TaxID=27381 RepID=A0A9N9B040_FUNMO|nr:3936_t:CDS:1 [Funneliformis mosseae]